MNAEGEWVNDAVEWENAEADDYPVTSARSLLSIAIGLSGRARKLLTAGQIEDCDLQYIGIDWF